MEYEIKIKITIERVYTIEADSEDEAAKYVDEHQEEYDYEKFEERRFINGEEDNFR